jgi:hypothetical protein
MPPSLFGIEKSHTALNLVNSAFVFSGVFIAEEVDGVGDKESGDTTTVGTQTILGTFLNMSLRFSCLNHEASF